MPCSRAFYACSVRLQLLSFTGRAVHLACVLCQGWQQGIPFCQCEEKPAEIRLMISMGFCAQVRAGAEAGARGQVRCARAGAQPPARARCRAPGAAGRAGRRVPVMLGESLLLSNLHQD